MDYPLSEIFNNPKYQPPFNYKGEDFQEFVNELFDDFISDIENIKDQLISDELVITKSGVEYSIRTIRKLCEAIKNSIKAYYNGDVKIAIGYLEDGIKESGTEKNWLTTYLPAENSLYRIRNLRNSYGVKAKELLHIPFESRGKVATQRFSIPGYPSLYLGNSIYVCWEELSRCPIENVHAMRFVNHQQFRYIDLTINRFKDVKWYSEHYGEILGSEAKLMLSSARIWPLIAACSIIVSNKEDNFKPEYIIPQLLLQYVKKNKNIDAIKYTSTRIDFDSHSDDFANFVFPVKTQKQKGYCHELCQMFQYTKPNSFELGNIEEGQVFIYNNHEMNKLSPYFDDVEIQRGFPMKYASTKLGKFERKLFYQNELYDVWDLFTEKI